MVHARTPVIILAITMLLGVSHFAHALSRSYKPLAVLVAEADAIVEAHITVLPALSSKTDGTAVITVGVDQVLKGDLAKGSTEALMTSMARFWGEVQWKEGGHYLLLLKRSSGQTKFEVTDFGSRPYSDNDAREIASLVQRLPSWSKAENGLSTLLTTEVPKFHVGDEIDLWVGCRNDSNAEITLRYTDWPRATSSKWKLEVRKEGGDSISAMPHPTLTSKDIEDYFSKHGKSYAVLLKPGEYHWFILQRISSAKPGWGYKEELDYQYYPMTAPGKYIISVSGENLLKEGVLRAGTAEVTLE
ncbi:hypothetical protein DES53_10726 [Roseimicrobium gellanilyticum]|uniref:Uncharacterized protein n=1 Tax=Roseimicrobium gellanilyticum TaxID=748857 RepID=A0A366HF95_9BACT|nr:hypothetical protein [Roseimicrobium gellanilyticum]RBP41197.1 hypothetical protein DES53_10726 [Roseimicrobium gellanilyticum]